MYVADFWLHSQPKIRFYYGEREIMAANLRIRMSLKMAIGPLHPVGKADVYLTVHPEEDGTARVDISRITFINNSFFTLVAGVLKERLTGEINRLVKEVWMDLPKHIPRLEEISILEIGNELPA
jgi:hypothetical protein